MRFVIYDDESMEPITVINLPITERDALERGRWLVALPGPFIPFYEEAPSPSMNTIPVVEIQFEPFRRNSLRQGEQRTVIAFTRATELAMLLDPAWLPGQQSAVRYLQDQNDRLTSMLMAAHW